MPPCVARETNCHFLPNFSWLRNAVIVAVATNLPRTLGRSQERESVCCSRAVGRTQERNENVRSARVCNVHAAERCSTRSWPCLVRSRGPPAPKVSVLGQRQSVLEIPWTIFPTTCVGDLLPISTALSSPGHSMLHSRSGFSAL